MRISDWSSDVCSSDLVYPAEAALDAAPRPRRHALLQDLMQRAKERDLWALGHPRELGGQGLPFMAYVRINEVIGRSFWAMQALGTLSLPDSLMVNQHCSEERRVGKGWVSRDRSGGGPDSKKKNKEKRK